MEDAIENIVKKSIIANIGVISESVSQAVVQKIEGFKNMRDKQLLKEKELQEKEDALAIR
jgi:hypothetical protein